MTNRPEPKCAVRSCGQRGTVECTSQTALEGVSPVYYVCAMHCDDEVALSLRTGGPLQSVTFTSGYEAKIVDGAFSFREWKADSPTS